MKELTEEQEKVWKRLNEVKRFTGNGTQTTFNMTAMSDAVNAIQSFGRALRGPKEGVVLKVLKSRHTG